MQFLDTNNVNGILEAVLCFVAAGFKGIEGQPGERGPEGRPGLKGDEGDRGFPGQKGMKYDFLSAFRKNHTFNAGNITFRDFSSVHKFWGLFLIIHWFTKDGGFGSM